MDSNNIKIDQAEKIFDSLVDTGKCSRDAELWLINATDPFHDLPERVAGFPDVITSPSVVQVFKQTFTVSRPASVPAGNNWDCVIHMHQVDGITNITPITLTNGNVITYFNPQVSSTLGGVTAYGVASGTPVFLNSVIGQTSLNNTILTSGMPFRVTAKGFETENTTSDLNKQGSVIVYSVPNQDPSSALNTWNLLSPGGPVPPLNLFQGVSSGPLLGSIPSNPSQAMILPYSRQWEAKYGTYQVATMCSQTNQPNDLGPEFFIIKDVTDPVGIFRVPTGGLVAANNTVGPTSFWPISPYNSPGCFYTGLSSETTLTITAQWTIERFPSYSDIDLVTMASPSPAYCPAIIELYATTMRKMPVGVKKKDNDIGEYVATLADIVAPLLGLPPVGTVIKKGYDLVSGALSGLDKDWNQVPTKKATKKRIKQASDWETTSGFTTNAQPAASSNSKLPQKQKNKPKQPTKKSSAKNRM